MTSRSGGASDVLSVGRSHSTVPRNKSLIVSLHDVAPPFDVDIEAQLTALEELGIRRLVLKVVPNWHGQHPLSASPYFVERLQEWVVIGSQVVLHGVEHQPHGELRGSPARHLRARLFAARAAEFMTLSTVEATRMVEAGQAELARAGLPNPHTFCPPGWLMSDEAEEGVAESGIRVVTGMLSWRDLSVRRLHWLPARGYMGGGFAHEAGIRALDGIVGSSARRSTVLKIYLHPDTSGRRRWMGMVRRIAVLIEDGWDPTTFEDIASRPDLDE